MFNRVIVKLPVSSDHLNGSQHDDRLNRELKAILKGEATPPTPFILIDLERLDQQIDLWHLHMPCVTPYFAIKACDVPSILRHMHTRGICFDAATGGELALLVEQGIPGRQIVMTHPIRSPQELDLIRQWQPAYLVVQDSHEISKLADAGIPNRDYSPTLLVRLAVPDSNLNKFGVPCIVPAHGSAAGRIDHRPIQQIFETAVSSSRRCAAAFGGFGLAGHVGTNTTIVEPYTQLLEYFFQIHRNLLAHSQIRLTYFDIGGGYCDQRSALAVGTSQEMLLKDIHSACVKFQESLETPVTLIAEPGRLMVADAGVSVCRVTASSIQDWRFEDGTAIYERHKVAYLDDGVYGNFMSQGPEKRFWDLRPLRVHSPEPIDGAELPAIFWGPTCDTYDRLAVADNFRVSEHLQAGDYIVSDCMGAYTLVTGTAFNRTRPTTVVFMQRHDDTLELEW